LTGELSETAWASRVPSLAVSPIANKHCPDLTEAALVLLVTEYDVLAVVVTVVVPDPNCALTVMVDPVTAVTVPATPSPPPEKFGGAPPAPGLPVGIGIVPAPPPSVLKPPGGPPEWLRLNEGAAHFDVLVIVTSLAFTAVGADGRVSGEAVGRALGGLDRESPVGVTWTQSPTATPERVVLEVRVNVVIVPNATFFEPADVLTVAPALPTPLTLPIAMEKPGEPGWPLVPAEALVPTEARWLLPDPPPQPATRIAMATPPMTPIKLRGASIRCSVLMVLSPLIVVTRSEAHRSEPAARLGWPGTRRS